MKKQIPAVLAALLVTALLTGGMFAIIGGQSSANAASLAATATPVVQVTSTDTAQLQALVAEYQAREAQYQAQLSDAASRIDTANQQLATANQQIQEYQNVLTQLQNSGLITVGSDGSITVNQQQASFPQFGDHHDGAHH